jgi:L-amino acid N-acyltransferase YncA
VILVIGAVPEAHGSGLGRVLAAGIARALQQGGYERVHTTWVHESATGSKALVRRIGFHQTREYAIFQKALSD